MKEDVNTPAMKAALQCLSEPDGISRRRVVQAAVAGAASSLGAFLPAEAWAAGGDLVIAIPNNPSTFDPVNSANHDAMVVTQCVFENLIGVDVEGKLYPQLATKLPAITNGGKTYTFELREGVFFQNGQPFTAEDVKYSFDYLLDPKNNTLRRPLFNRISSIVIEGKHRVRFELSEPYRPLLHYMQKYMGIFPSGSRERHGADFFKSSPIGVGTGPGIFVEWKQNDRVVLRKNPNYWNKGTPGWDRAIVRIIPDENSRQAYFLTGNVDIISAPSPKDLVMLKKKAGVKVDQRLALGGWFFMLTNNKKAPFDDVNFRRAVATAIDREMIAKNVYYDLVEPTTIAAPRSAWWYDAQAGQINQYNKAAALEHLKKSKYASGAQFDMLVPSSPYLVDVKDAAVVIQAQLAEIGIKVNIQEMEQGILLNQFRLGNHVSALQVNISPGEPTYMIDIFYGKNTVLSKASGYENNEVWKMIAETYHETNEDKLKVIFSKLLTKLAQDSPHIWLGCVYSTNAWKSNVQGFKVNQGLTMRIADAFKN